MSIWPNIWPVVVLTSAVDGVLPIAIPIGIDMIITRLRALLYRVSSFSCLSRLDTSNLVDLNLSFWWVLDMHIHQRG